MLPQGISKCLMSIIRLKEYTMSQKLAGKVAVVTGASKGIGASIALHLAAEGAAVVAHYASDKGGAARGGGGRAHLRPGQGGRGRGRRRDRRQRRPGRRRAGEPRQGGRRAPPVRR